MIPTTEGGSMTLSQKTIKLCTTMHLLGKLKFYLTTGFPQPILPENIPYCALDVL